MGANDSDSSGKREELEQLFNDWDDRDLDGAEPGAAEAEIRILGFGIRLRLVMSLILFAVAAAVMIPTWSRLSYFLEDSEPVAAVDLRKAWLAGERTLPGTSNTYAALDGLVITMESPEYIREGDGGEIVARHRFFFCPLFNIVVLTPKELPEKPWHRTVDIVPGFIELLQQRRAFPYDLAVEFNGVGRLVAGDDAPAEMRKAVNTYSAKLDIDKSDLWVFIDGNKPKDHGLMVAIWILAMLVPLVSVIFLLRALRERSQLQGKRA